MNTRQFLKEFQGEAAKIVRTVKSKNADYSHSNDDPFRNFRMIERLTNGRISAVDGLLVRISDKLTRVVNLTAPKARAKVKGEAVEDTLIDQAAYSIIAAILVRQNRRGRRRTKGA